MLSIRPTKSIRRARAFTIVELLVVIGVIGILAALTTIGARRLTAGSRLAAGTNAVTSALGNARAAAIRDGVMTAVVFRPVWDSSPARRNLPQRVEVVTVRSTGERYPFLNSQNQVMGFAERFLPANNVPAVVLPEGIKVAGPNFDPPSIPSSPVNENTFSTQAELPRLEQCGEAIDCNRVIAVMFGADGQFISRPSKSPVDLDAKSFVDWNNFVPPLPADPQQCNLGDCGNGGNFDTFWLQDHVDDECNLMFVPFLVVYDDKAAREQKGTDWSNTNNLLAELTGANGFIAQFGDKITFNRFSGIPERKVR